MVSVELVGRKSPTLRAAAQAREASTLVASEDTVLSALEEEERALPPRSIAEEEEGNLAEFRELVVSAGAEIIDVVVQRRQKADPATLIGQGKVEEIAGLAEATSASLILFDHDLSPTQLRNLENSFPCRVIDRTQLILDIFANHARTREGQLQVELAQLEYMLPRLTGRGRAMSQLGGGIGTRGPGETQLETDRRKIQRRLLQLRHELENVRRARRQQRQRRESVPVPTIALVGYTNAGKSTLFNRLTNAGVLESSRMFATLDPKLRAIVLPSRRKVLLSDTVGFIRNLPHTLVTSFRATLEEVEKAELLLHVQDVSSPFAPEHKLQVEKVLAEIESFGKPTIQVLNKSDLLGEEARSHLSQTQDANVLISARDGQGIEELLLAIDRLLTADPVVDAILLVPQSEGGVLAALGAGAVIRKRSFEGNNVRLEVTLASSLLGRYREFCVQG